jgi:hypothetical protein
MTRTTRIARIALAAGLTLGVLAPASAALALTPPAPSNPTEFAPAPTGPGPKGPDEIAPGPTEPECKKIICIDDFGPGDKTPGDNPGDNPGDQPGDEPGDGGSNDSGSNDSSDDTEVMSDTVVATPNFTG